MKTVAATVGHFFLAVEKVISLPPFKFHLAYYTAGRLQRQLEVKPIIFGDGSSIFVKNHRKAGKQYRRHGDFQGVPREEQEHAVPQQAAEAPALA